MKNQPWSPTDERRLRELRKAGRTYTEIARELGRSWDSTHAKGQSMALPTPVRRPPPAVKPDPGRDVKRLVQLCKGKGRTLREVCDALDLSPKQAERLVEQARRMGYTIDISGGEVAWTNPAIDARQATVRIAPVAGRYAVGIISDTHFGSRHCMAAELADFVRFAHSRGVRDILHAGDMLAGQSEKIRWDLARHGLDEQCAAAFDGLPMLDGLTYHFVDGNHDEHFWSATGQLTGPRLVDYFESRGRHDLDCVGQRAGHVLLKVPECKRPVVVKLWHPKAGKSYALSYQPQNHIRDLGVGIKPDILVCGHWHVGGYFAQRGVHALLAGTFEGPGSSFSQSLGGAVTNGGWIVSFGVTAEGTIRDFVPALRTYYVAERARELELSPGGLDVTKQDRALDVAMMALRSAVDIVSAKRGKAA